MVLRDVADDLCHFLRLHRLRVFAAKLNCATLRFQQSRDAVQQCALPSTVRAEDGHDLPFVKLKVHVVQDLSSLAVIPEAEVLDIDDAHEIDLLCRYRRMA